MWRRPEFCPRFDKRRAKIGLKNMGLFNTGGQFFTLD